LRNFRLGDKNQIIIRFEVGLEMAGVLFYVYVFAGILLFLYLFVAHQINKKRDRLISEMQADYTRQKFLKCPHCGVLNAKDATVCQYCNEELHRPVAPIAPSPPQMEPAPPQTVMQAPKPVIQPSAAPQGQKGLLNKFPYKYIWPTPKMSFLITIITVYILVLLLYGFFAGIYMLGKKGVEELNQARRQSAGRIARREAASSGMNVPYSTGSQAPSVSAPPSLPVRTLTPIPTPSPLVLTGSMDEQITHLMLILESGNWNRAIQARRALIQMGKSAAIALAKEVNHPDEMMRTHVITALSEIAEPSTASALVSALSNQDIVTVIQAVWALRNFKDEEVVNVLRNQLRHKDWRVRMAAIGSLEKQSNPSIVAALVEMQNDPNSRVQDAAKNALQRLQKKE
jgi:hypothetical protein